MTTISIEAQVSTDQLLRALEQLPAKELATFAAQVIALRAQREAPHLTQSETRLLLQINQSLPEHTQPRFDELVAKRQTETVTTEEMRELIHLTDQIEQRDAQRLAALVELANLRGMTLDVLMASLGVTPSTHG